MKIYFLYYFKEGPFGGANQFLKALKNILEKKGVVTEFPEKADVILFNSHSLGGGRGDNFLETLKLKKKNSEKLFFHRVDGPVSGYRQSGNKKIDKLIFKINGYVAEATIFQSEWSKKENLKMGMEDKDFQATILNAPDKEIFNLRNKKEFNPDKKIRLIASSWSNFRGKGFELYKYLDENLDFSKYDMTFIGNSPIHFKNIKQIKPLGSRELAQELKKHDIFITASEKDPCSNSLIEALHCGLPAVALNDGGHTEIVGKGGELFKGKSDIIEKIDKLVQNYASYQSKIKLPDIFEVADKYYEFISSVFRQKPERKKFFYLFLFIYFYYFRLSKKIKRKIFA